jgi:putative endonuclease
VVFIEVKFRNSLTFGFPEQFLSQGQMERIASAALAWQEENQYHGLVRFDVIAATLKGSVWVFRHFEDAFA